MSFVAIFFPSVRFNTGSNFGSHRLHFVFLSFSFAMCACMHAKSLQSCLILSDPMDCSLPGSSVHGILQARILEWVAMWEWNPVSLVSCIVRRVLYHQRHLVSPFLQVECNHGLLRYYLFFRYAVLDREAWPAAFHGVAKSDWATDPIWSNGLPWWLRR